MTIEGHIYDEMKKTAINLYIQLLDSKIMYMLLEEGKIETIEDLLKAIENLPDGDELKAEYLKLQRLPDKAREQVLSDAKENLASFYYSIEEAETYIEELNEQLILMNNNIINKTKHSKRHKERLRKNIEKLLEMIEV